MKPITILIPLIAMLCGCEEKTHTVDMREFVAFKIKMQNELYDINMKINALESPEKNRNREADITLSDHSTGRLVARGEIKEIQIVEVPKGFTLITLPDGRPALIPDDK